MSNYVVFVWAQDVSFQSSEGFKDIKPGLSQTREAGEYDVMTKQLAKAYQAPGFGYIKTEEQEITQVGKIDLDDFEGEYSEEDVEVVEEPETEAT